MNFFFYFFFTYYTYTLVGHIGTMFVPTYIIFLPSIYYILLYIVLHVTVVPMYRFYIKKNNIYKYTQMRIYECNVHVCVCVYVTIIYRAYDCKCRYAQLLMVFRSTFLTFNFFFFFFYNAFSSLTPPRQVSLVSKCYI